MRLFSLIITYLLCAFSMAGQVYERDYAPLREFQAPDELVKKLQYRFAAWSGRATIDNKKVKQAFEQFAKQRPAYFGALDSMDLLMYTDPISVFLNQIAAQLVSANPALQPSSFYVFTQRSIEPNAYSLGEGIIFVSLGLLDRIETVDQLAFVIAHEMGHDHLQHGFNDGLRFCEHYFDPAFQQSLSKIKRKEAGRATKIKSLMNSFRASHMRHSRGNEMQADSFGLVISLGAGFDERSGVQVLKILDSADHFRFTDTLVLQSFFDFPDYPFKSRWLSKENTMLNWEADAALYETPDSLKSHPDCSMRIEQIERLTKPARTTVSAPADLSHDLRNTHEKIPFEFLEAIMHGNDYVLGLYFSLHLQQRYPENHYLKCVAAHSLFELAGALIRNEFLEYVEFPDHSYSPGYNHLLAFLHNMNSATLTQLFLRYKQQHLVQAEKHPYAGYLNVIEDRLVTKDEIEAYQATCNDPYFIQLLNEAYINNN